MGRPGAAADGSHANLVRAHRKNSRSKNRGFTLLELLVVIAIIAVATAGVSLSLRDSSQTALEREAQRLAVLFESARAQSRANGTAVIWRPTVDGFRFEGLRPDALPTRWLEAGTRAGANVPIQLGPEPIIGARLGTGRFKQHSQTLRLPLQRCLRRVPQRQRNPRRRHSNDGDYDQQFKQGKTGVMHAAGQTSRCWWSCRR